MDKDKKIINQEIIPKLFIGICLCMLGFSIYGSINNGLFDETNNVDLFSRVQIEVLPILNVLTILFYVPWIVGLICLWKRQIFKLYKILIGVWVALYFIVDTYMFLIFNKTTLGNLYIFTMIIGIIQNIIKFIIPGILFEVYLYKSKAIKKYFTIPN
jgi:hypothetical protein